MMDTESFFNSRNSHRLTTLSTQFNGGISLFDSNTVSKNFNSQEPLVGKVHLLQPLDPYENRRNGGNSGGNEISSNIAYTALRRS
ncbi:hypothetical protein RP20_CCG007889 [Aedes albopictus]|nr:hypothetical protein RP20_CCG007889 [Aedes albopictus]